MPSVSNSPAKAYDQITDIVQQIRMRATRMSQDIQNTLPVEGRDVLHFYESLGGYRVKLQTLTAVPHLNAYVQDIYGDGAADLIADYNAFRTQLDAFVSLVDANYPKSSGFWNVVQTSAGVVTWAQLTTLLTAPQRTGLVNALSNLATAAAPIA
jgi:hypothetical protein